MEVDSEKLDEPMILGNSVVETPAGSASESSSEDEGVGGESLESDGSSPDSSEHPNDDENEWSEDSEPSLGSASSEAKSADQLLFPAVLPATSVRLMAQGVGCDISYHAAAALGHLAMNKLRRVVMIANQLRKHDQSQGLSVDHFSVAEKLLGGESFGHKGVSSLPDFKHVGKGISVLEDTRQIDLLATVQHARDNPAPLRKMSTLSLSHHQLPTAMFTGVNDEDVNGNPAETDYECKGDALSMHTAIHKDDVPDCLDSSSADSVYFVRSDEDEKNTTKCELSGTGTSKTRNEITVTSSPNGKALVSGSNSKLASKLEKVMEKILVLNEEVLDSEETNGGENPDLHPCVVVGIEWIDYMKVFIGSFFCNSNEPTTMTSSNIGNDDITTKNEETSDNNCPPSVQCSDVESQQTKRHPSQAKMELSSKSQQQSTDFNLLLEDVRSNGTFPVLGIILNFFNDYINRKFGNCDVHGLRRILAFMEATLQCTAQTDPVYLTKTWTTLVKLMSFPPPCDLHQKIVHVLILLITKGGREFSVRLTTWISEYITATLNSVLNSCLHSLNLNTTLLNLSLSIAIALGNIGIHFMLDLDWHSPVLEFLQAMIYVRSHQNTEGIALSSSSSNEEPMDIDQSVSSAPTPIENDHKVAAVPPKSLQETVARSEFKIIAELEETLLVFFRLLMKNYSEVMPLKQMEEIHEILMEAFGEKIVPYITTTWLGSDLHMLIEKKRLKRKAVTPGSIRRVNWKSRSVIVGKMFGAL